MEEGGRKLHLLILPYPTQGHVNPMLQFCRSLASKGAKTTVAVTNFIFNTFKPKPGGCFEWDTISDGYDDGGFAAANSIDEYLVQVQTVGSKTLTDLILRHQSSDHPIHGVVYDSFMPWVLDVAKGFGLPVASFFTQPCVVNLIYYCVHGGSLSLPISKASSPILLAGLPPLEPSDLPSLVSVPSSYPQYLHLLVNQLSNIQKADWILINTIYEFEPQEVDEMSKLGPALTIGPTIPSLCMSNHKENGNGYGLDLFPTNLEDTSSTMKWLATKSKGSIIYVSFGSMANLNIIQMAELAAGLTESNYSFIWVVRASEEAKLPKDFTRENNNKGIVVQWSAQVEVLSNEAVGCFFTHCGWNSTIEALCLGVPMVAMPQWTDQPTNAKYVEDVWKVGVRVKVGEDGIVGKEEIKACIKTVMEGERAKELKENALKWKQIGLEAIGEGGSSTKNIDQLISDFREKKIDYN